MKVSEVFNPGGFPVYTYNPRNKLELEEKFKDYIESGNKLLSLTGPTKSGKTVLCRQLIPKEHGIWISGGDIHEENDFWMAIITNLNLYTSISSGNNKEESETVSSKVEGGVSAIFKVGGEVSESEGKVNAQSQTLT